MFVSILAALAGLGAAGYVAAEATIRALGFLDYPLYDAPDGVGYIPKPSQRGRLRTSPKKPAAPWAYNELSMGVANPFQASPDGVVLLGDSLVQGSAKTPQANKLGPLLQKRLERPVWPIGSGSWGLTNELIYLQEHPEVLDCGTLVVIVNSGDFQDKSTWKDPMQHPRRRPMLALPYLLAKRKHRPELTPFAYPTPKQEAEWGDRLDWLFSTYTGRVVFVLYPNKLELKSGEDKFTPIRRRLAGRAEILETRPHWKVEYFRDNTHPTDTANPVLADLLAEAVRSEPRSLPVALVVGRSAQG